MHVMATNICVWIRTLVLESLKEVTAHYIARGNLPEKSPIAEDLRQHTLIHAGMTMGTELGPGNALTIERHQNLSFNFNFFLAPPDAEWISKPSRSLNMPGISAEDSPGHLLDRLIQSTTNSIATVASTLSTTQSSTIRSTSTTRMPITTTTDEFTTTARSFFQSGFNAINSGYNNIRDSVLDTTTTQAPAPDHPVFAFDDSSENIATTAPGFFDGFVQTVTEKFGSIADLRPDPTSNIDHDFESLSDKFDMPHAEAFRDLSTIAPFHLNATSCERVNIMGTIVQDSTPYLYPFIIEYSLIGAVVIYVMWKHIGRYPKYSQDEDLEHRLEVMLSRRAVALAQAGSGRVDCVGASKGLFFGLLLLVGSTICLILFFVLVRHEQFRILAYYLADASHGVLMIFAILAILIGFCR